MGLQFVGLVYKLEEEFEISIPNEEAEKMTTPRAVMITLLISLLFPVSGRKGMSKLLFG